MAKNIIIAMVLLICLSCGAPNVAMTTDVQKDSVSVIIKESVIYRDTIIYIEVPVEVDRAVLPDTDTSLLETSLAISQAWVNSGKLHHTLTHKEDAGLEKKISIKDKSVVRDSVIRSYQRDVVEKEVEKPINKWQQFRMTLGSLVLIAVSVWFFILILKKIIL